jgi:uncharacterized membrane protein
MANKRSKLTVETASPGLSPTLDRNIQALLDRRRREAAGASLQARIADGITRFTGSMAFVYLHLAVFGFWIIANLELIPGLEAWDTSFVMLAMVASVEAIFLSTFVLITQNRMVAAADTRADLDLQISLLTEHELTRLLRLSTQIGQRLGIHTEGDSELQEAARDIKPEEVLDHIKRKKT